MSSTDCLSVETILKTSEIILKAQRLETVPDLSQFKNITHLDLSDNRLTSFPDIREHGKLVSLCLSGNDLDPVAALKKYDDIIWLSV